MDLHLAVLLDKFYILSFNIKDADGKGIFFTVFLYSIFGEVFYRDGEISILPVNMSLSIKRVWIKTADICFTGNSC